MFQNNLLWTEGVQIFLVIVFLGFVSLAFFKRALWLVLAFLLFSFYFFRNPERVCLEAQTDKTVLICPADGKIVDLQFDESAPFDGYERKVSIFLSPLDVHVQWMPFSGTVEKVLYKPGTFAMAFLPKSSELNERNEIHVACDNGKTMMVRQIAGTIARRVVCWVNEGDEVVAGQKFGMIRFGSRVDILLPAGVALSVGMGQRVYGGQTVLGRWQKH